MYAQLVTGRLTAHGVQRINAIDRDSGASATIELTSGERSSSVDVGLYRLLALNARVFEDAAGDGVWTSADGDAGQAGVRVRLVSARGDTLRECDTDASGACVFDALEPARYALHVDAPTGASWSAPLVDEAALAANPTAAAAGNASCVDSLGRSPRVWLSAARAEPTLFAGYYVGVAFQHACAFDDRNG